MSNNRIKSPIKDLKIEDIVILLKQAVSYITSDDLEGLCLATGIELKPNDSYIDGLKEQIGLFLGEIADPPDEEYYYSVFAMHFSDRHLLMKYRKRIFSVIGMNSLSDEEALTKTSQMSRDEIFPLISRNLDEIKIITVPDITNSDFNHYFIYVFMWCSDGVTDLILSLELIPKGEDLFLEFKNLVVS